MSYVWICAVVHAQNNLHETVYTLLSTSLSDRKTCYWVQKNTNNIFTKCSHHPLMYLSLLYANYQVVLIVQVERKLMKLLLRHRAKSSLIFALVWIKLKALYTTNRTSWCRDILAFKTSVNAYKFLSTTIVRVWGEASLTGVINIDIFQPNLMEESQEEVDKRDMMLNMYQSLKEALKVMGDINMQVGTRSYDSLGASCCTELK